MASAATSDQARCMKSETSVRDIVAPSHRAPAPGTCCATPIGTAGAKRSSSRPARSRPECSTASRRGSSCRFASLRIPQAKTFPPRSRLSAWHPRAARDARPSAIRGVPRTTRHSHRVALIAGRSRPSRHRAGGLPHLSRVSTYESVTDPSVPTSAWTISTAAGAALSTW
jgi:hypothetical protein